MYIRGLNEAWDVEVTAIGGTVAINSPQLAFDFWDLENIRRGIVEKVLNIKQ